MNELELNNCREFKIKEDFKIDYEHIGSCGSNKLAFDAEKQGLSVSLPRSEPYLYSYFFGITIYNTGKINKFVVKSNSGIPIFTVIPGDGLILVLETHKGEKSQDGSWQVCSLKKRNDLTIFEPLGDFPKDEIWKKRLRIVNSFNVKVV